MAADKYQSSNELRRALVGGAPLAGAAYSQVVPTRFAGAAAAVGFVHGFRPGPDGGSVDSPSDVRYLDAATAKLLEDRPYTGEHRSRPAPPTNTAARERMYALQDALMSAFFAAHGKPTSPGDKTDYLTVVPDAVGPTLMVYYEELAPDWFAWLRTAQ